MSAGVADLARSVAAEYGGEGIRVNAATCAACRRRSRTR